MPSHGKIHVAGWVAPVDLKAGELKLKRVKETNRYGCVSLPILREEPSEVIGARRTRLAWQVTVGDGG